MLNAIHEGRGAKILKAIALGFITMGVFGLVLMDVGGFFSGATGSQNLARVGSNSIEAQEFERSVTNILRNQGMSLQEAYRFGTLKTLLNERIDADLIRQEAQEQRLILDRETIATIVHALIMAQVQPGETPQDALERLLRAQGISESQLIASINQSETSTLLQTPLDSAGTYVPALATQALSRLNAERRDISFFALTAEQAGRDIKADDATLQSFFETIKDQYQIPEQRKFKVISLDMNALKGSIKITDAEVEDAYNQRRDQFRIGEQRRIEQIVTRSADEAAKFASAARDGATMKNLTTGSAYRAPTDVTREGLPPEIGEAVFAAAKNTVLNPISTPLGFHVIRIIDIKPAHTQELAAVRTNLRRELESDALHQEMESRITRVDEAISAGESIEEIASSLETEVSIIGPIDATGAIEGTQTNATLTALANNPDLLNVLFELMEGETGDLNEISDGVYAVFALESVRPTRDRAFSEVRADIEKRWLAEQRTAALNATVQTLLQQIESGERSFEEAAREMKAQPRTVRDVSRESKIAGLSDPLALSRLFEVTDLNRVVNISNPEGIILAKVLDARIPPAASSSPEPELAEQWRTQTQMALNNLFFDELRRKYKIRINEKNFERAFNSPQNNY